MPLTTESLKPAVEDRSDWDCQVTLRFADDHVQTFTIIRDQNMSWRRGESTAGDLVSIVAEWFHNPLQPQEENDGREG